MGKTSAEAVNTGYSHPAGDWGAGHIAANER